MASRQSEVQPPPLDKPGLHPKGMRLSSRFSVPALVSLAAASLLYSRRSRASRVRRGQVAVITGGSTGLGLALAHQFGKAGLRLVLAAQDESHLEDARRQLLAKGSVADEDDILLVSCDLSDREQAEGLIQETLRTFGTVDILINNAGIIEVGPAEDQVVETYKRTMEVNFFTALYTTYAALPHLLGRQSGAIVNISSIGGKVAVPHLLPYVAAKFALTGFSEGLHAELRSKGIRVTTVCPGLMRTGGEAHAHFHGQIAKEKAWFQTSARTPILSAGVDRAAREIFQAVQHGRAEITITPQAWMAARFAGLAPESTQALSAMVNAHVLPDAVQGNPAMQQTR